MLIYLDPLQIWTYICCVIEILCRCTTLDVGDMKQHLMFVHAINGCDNVSAPYMKGKNTAIEVVRSFGDQDSLSTFNEPRSPPEDITNVEV